MAYVDAHRDVPWDDIARIRADLHEADRGATVGRMAQRQRVDRFDKSRRAAQRIVSRFHRRRARVRVLTRPRTVVPAKTQSADHDTNGLALALKYRSLLNVRLEVRVERGFAQRRGTGISDAVERFAKFNTVDVAL